MDYMAETIIDEKENKIKTLWTDITVSQCILSPLNTRQNAPKDAVEKLAERIKRYGFETTRALWAVKNKDVFEVFAGGLRLERAKKAIMLKIQKNTEHNLFNRIFYMKLYEQ